MAIRGAVKGKPLTSLVTNDYIIFKDSIHEWIGFEELEKN